MTAVASGSLRIRGLTAGYGGPAVLHDVDLDVDPGTIAAVVGANGAGKTTLLRAVSGLAPRCTGSITWEGAELRGTRVEDLVRRGVAHVPEGRGVITELTVEENLRLGHLWRNDPADGRRAVAEVLDMFEPLARRRTSAGHLLSGGERQMLAIGRALVGRPRLLLLDEPSLGLAPKVTAQIMALLRHLKDETGLTILLVEQNVRSALSVADRGIVLSLGRVVVDDDASTLAGDADLRHAYLGF
jgi:branched-chain amino acid transport system ATP-binding protein